MAGPTFLWAGTHFDLMDLTVVISLAVFAGAALGWVVVRKPLYSIWHWRREVRRRLTQLVEQAHRESSPTTRQAYALAVANLEAIQRQVEPSLQPLADLPEFCKQLAARCQPNATEPILEARIADVIATAQHALQRIDHLLAQPGLNLLRRQRIHHVRRAYVRYRRLQHHWVGRLFVRYQHWVGRLNRLRLALLPDPVSLLFFFSQHLLILSINRYLLLDIYLFATQVTIDLYHGGKTPNPASDMPPDLEELETMLEIGSPAFDDPVVQAIRAKLLGWSRWLVSTPPPEEVQQSLRTLVEHIAAREFPASPHPLEEASIDVVLLHFRSWLTQIAGAQQWLAIKRIYYVKLSWIVSGQRLLENIPKDSHRVVRDLYQLWRRARTPNRLTPAGMLRQGAAIAAHRLLLRWLYAKLFDITYREIARIYLASKVAPVPSIKRTHRKDPA